MRVVKLESVVPKNRQLSLTVPLEILSSPVEVHILAKDADAQQASRVRFLDALESEPSARSPEATESVVAAERGAWDEQSIWIIVPSSS